MNKQDLIGKVAEITGMQKSDSEKAVNAVFDQITDVLKQRGEVRLVGFGTFKTSIRKASQVEILEQMKLYRFLSQLVQSLLPVKV